MLKNGMYIDDRYEIVGKIGAGGMSDVYKAKDHTLGRNVAIKVLKQEFSEDSTFVTKFRSEAQSAAGLEHPNIVNVYDVGCENGDYYIVMEYVEGITLKTYIEKKGQLSFKEALSIAIQVGRGIQAAHAKNIIHRDIKPQNIMISTEGKVKVTDFGIARAASSNTINSDVMGSVHYASPEQARNGYVSAKSDIYSLGIVMYEMVTGRVPFDGDSTVSVAIQHLQEEMVAPSAYAPDLPISLEKIILKCTQKNADRRYDSMDDLLIDLRKSLLSPNEDFVTIIPINKDKTRVISSDELEEIQKKSGTVTYNEPEDADEAEPEDADEDEEEEDEAEDEKGRGLLNPKMDKAVSIMGVVALVVIILVVVLLLGSFKGWFHFGGSSNNKAQTSTVSEGTSENNTDAVTMIDVTGLTYDAANTKLKGMGLVLEQSGTATSDKYSAGQIISQDITKGSSVKKGTTVKVVVCTDEVEEVTVVDVVGDSESEAKSALEDAGFKVSKQYDYSDKEMGTVTKQSPESGEKLSKGGTVTIYISQGSETVKVPDVKGKTESAAKSALESAGLSVGKTSQDYSDDVASGKVISQSTAGGKYLDKGDTVDLVISKGAEPKADTYYFSAKVTAPTSDNAGNAITVTSADIELTASESDEVIESWSGVSTFPYSISKKGISDADAGTLTITWYFTYEDGSSSSDVQTQSVSFKKE